MSENSKHYYLPIERSYIPNDVPVDNSLERMRADYELAREQITLREAVSRFNHLIQERGGIILADGQILSSIFSASDVIDYGIEVIDLHEIQEFYPRVWGKKQKDYFGIENPYQLADDNKKYSYGWILLNIYETYLEEGERILALLHGEEDERPFYCVCHHAEVVYTSKRRFICMMCGMLHCVIEETLNQSFKVSLTEGEWYDYFGPDGKKNEEEIELDIVDFQDIENVPKIWITDQYEQATRELIFFARSSPEELEAYWKTTVTPGELIEAGFSIVHQPPEPVFQTTRYKPEIDKITNAFDSLEQAVYAYQNGKTQSIYLKSAILQLFHVVELLLKIRLEELDPKALRKKPNNPTVIKLIQQKGVSLNNEERKTLETLRHFRNSLQHDEAALNYRTALSVLHKTFAFVDRFSVDELEIWIAEQIKEDAWRFLLSIPSIKSNAQRITKEIIEQIKKDSEWELYTCPRCNVEALVRNRGSICIYCRHRPTSDELE